ncbi:uncharacterized protein MCYG_05471 [Microsporum canis CBS 113480]|uniref:Uncharacterized protein n=1 Tax=Arthroderma otae (strain ATCC MYA-4605 / CBS 113480) TaxID=554155 RepID=C5FRZ9_ARTOC|nr:uncharacterized protein MCYG_05471 [Microsporum canis CBS 113480]EEQ32652.1 predicted protein [Microsporum canis CBS 113480]
MVSSFSYQKDGEAGGNFRNRVEDQLSTLQKKRYAACNPLKMVHKSSSGQSERCLLRGGHILADRFRITKDVAGGRQQTWNGYQPASERQYNRASHVAISMAVGYREETPCIRRAADS